MTLVRRRPWYLRTKHEMCQSMAIRRFRERSFFFHIFPFACWDTRGLHRTLILSSILLAVLHRVTSFAHIIFPSNTIFILLGSCILYKLDIDTFAKHDAHPRRRELCILLCACSSLSFQKAISLWALGWLTGWEPLLST